MKKICLIYANCQNALIAKYLSQSELFNQEYQIKRFPVHFLMKNRKTIPERLINQAKLFIYQPVSNAHGDRSTEHILRKLPSDCRRISFPSLYFKGYYPQYCKNPVNQVIDPNYPFGVFPHGDSNIIELLEQGKNSSEIIDQLSDPNFYSQECVLANLEETLGELARRESDLSIQVSHFIKRHYQDYYLFYTHNHPADILGIYVVNQILKTINLPPLNNELSHTNRGELDPIQLPIYPSVVKHLNLNFISDNIENKYYCNASFCTNRMTFARYIEEYVYLHNTYQDGASSYHFQAIKLGKQQKYKAAIAAQKQAIVLRANNAAYYGELGNLFQKQQNWDRAEVVFRKAIELSPDWSDFYKSLGDILIQKNDIRGALLAYTQTVKLEPQNDVNYAILADTLVKLNKSDLAQSYYLKAIEIAPANSNYYRDLGDIHHNNNNLDAAEVNYRQALNLAPQSIWLYIRLANTLTQQKKLDDAVSICRQGANVHSNNPNFYRNLGDIQLQNGDIENALNTYQKVIKLNPNYMQLIFTHIGNLLQDKVAHKTFTSVAS